MRTEFTIHPSSSKTNLFVNKDELAILLPILINQPIFAFEVINMQDGMFSVEYRSKSDNDTVFLKDYELSVLSDVEVFMRKPWDLWPLTLKQYVSANKQFGTMGDLRRLVNNFVRGL